MDPEDRISITVCGDGGCGKSSISLRLVRSKWTHDYDPTIEDSYSVTRVVDGRTYHLSIVDTAGQEEYRGLWATSNLSADAFLLVYDITNHDTLHALDYFNDLIDMDVEERQDSRVVPPIKIVAGNKCDLANTRQVPSAEGLAWAREKGCGFMETSARNVVNIEETFALLVRRVVAAREAAKNGYTVQSPNGTQGMHSRGPSNHMHPNEHRDGTTKLEQVSSFGDMNRKKKKSGRWWNCFKS